MIDGTSRYCLKCQKKFVPTNRFNFLCPQCNKSNKGVRVTQTFAANDTSGRVLKKDIPNWEC